MVWVLVFDMKTSKNSNSNHRLDFVDLLTLAFIVLKLCGVIEWSWIWVLSPMWIGIAITVVLSAIIGLVTGLRGSGR